MTLVASLTLPRKIVIATMSNTTTLSQNRKEYCIDRKGALQKAGSAIMSLSVLERHDMSQATEKARQGA